MSVEMFGLQAKERPLVGYTCLVPALNGAGYHTGTVTDQTACGNFIRVKCRKWIRPQWMAVSSVRDLRP